MIAASPATRPGRRRSPVAWAWRLTDSSSHTGVPMTNDRAGHRRARRTRHVQRSRTTQHLARGPAGRADSPAVGAVPRRDWRLSGFSSPSTSGSDSGWTGVRGPERNARGADRRRSPAPREREARSPGGDGGRCLHGRRLARVAAARLRNGRVGDRPRRAERLRSRASGSARSRRRRSTRRRSPSSVLVVGGLLSMVSTPAGRLSHLRGAAEGDADRGRLLLDQLVRGDRRRVREQRARRRSAQIVNLAYPVLDAVALVGSPVRRGPRQGAAARRARAARRSGSPAWRSPTLPSGTSARSTRRFARVSPIDIGWLAGFLVITMAAAQRPRTREWMRRLAAGRLVPGLPTLPAALGIATALVSWLAGRSLGPPGVLLVDQRRPGRARPAPAADRRLREPGADHRPRAAGRAADRRAASDRALLPRARSALLRRDHGRRSRPDRPLRQRLDGRRSSATSRPSLVGAQARGGDRRLERSSTEALNRTIERGRARLAGRVGADRRHRTRSGTPNRRSAT